MTREEHIEFEAGQSAEAARIARHIAIVGFLQNNAAAVLIDDDVLTIQPTIYCGIGRPDRTLEIAAADLVRITGGRIGGFSR